MKLLFSLLATFTILYSNGQALLTPQKIGHADWEYIFGQLPEYKQIENELKIYETQLKNQLKIGLD